MRTDRRYQRAKEIVTDPLVPRLNNGGIALCHHCQRACFFAAGPPPNNRGFLKYLVKRVHIESHPKAKAGISKLIEELSKNEGAE